ncbi:MAG: peptide chain release factor N(5)-glutamine methyltransferase [Sphingobium sp.]|nr:peptide chain release factor N(5)-glutamine methyltransferase [Sphingobium sp.]
MNAANLAEGVSPSAAQALRDAAQRLSAVSDTARLDAELLMAHAAGLSREELILRLRDLPVPDGFAGLVDRRMQQEPVSHITGTRDFWTLTLRVSSHVLTPRPDSETLIEAAVEHYAGTAGPHRVLDLGTGSGALLLASLDEWRGATGLGVDISAQALIVARNNARLCGMEERAQFRPGNWCDGIAERFDLILANPPYITPHALLPRDVMEYEPHVALFGGEDGLDAYRDIAASLANVMTDSSIALMEIGFDQGQSAADLFTAHGFSATLRRDMAGRARCLILRR